MLIHHDLLMRLLGEELIVSVERTTKVEAGREALLPGNMAATNFDLFLTFLNGEGGYVDSPAHSPCGSRM